MPPITIFAFLKLSFSIIFINEAVSYITFCSASERVKIGYFSEEKFRHSDVISTLKEYGFEEGNYQKILLVWDWGEGVDITAKHEYHICLLKFSQIINKIQERFGNDTSYYSDDTVRLLQLLKKSEMKNP